MQTISQLKVETVQRVTPVAAFQVLLSRGSPLDHRISRIRRTLTITLRITTNLSQLASTSTNNLPSWLWAVLEMHLIPPSQSSIHQKVLSYLIPNLSPQFPSIGLKTMSMFFTWKLTLIPYYMPLWILVGSFLPSLPKDFQSVLKIQLEPLQELSDPVTTSINAGFAPCIPCTHTLHSAYQAVAPTRLRAPQGIGLLL